MVVKDRVLNVVLGGGEEIRETILEALKLATIIGRPVAFEFNAIKMKVSPTFVGGVSFDRRGAGYTGKHIVDRYYNEYHKKCDAREERDERKRKRAKAKS